MIAYQWIFYLGGEMAHWKADLRQFEEDVRTGRRILDLTDKKDVVIFLNLEDDDVVRAVWERFLDQRPSVGEIAIFFIHAIGLDPRLTATRLRSYFQDWLHRLVPAFGSPGLLDHLLLLISGSEKALAMVSWIGLRVFCILYPAEGDRRMTLHDLNHVIDECPHPEVIEQAVTLRDQLARDYLEDLSDDHIGHA